MTIYAYCRTSELEDSMDADRLNGILEPELLGIQTYCLQKGWYMTQTITETNCRWSQEFIERERGKLLLEAMNPGDVLLCSRLERIASSSQEALMLINLFSLYLFFLASVSRYFSAHIYIDTYQRCHSGFTVSFFVLL